MERNVVKKAAEKITNYRDLEIKIQKCWKLQKVRTIPIIMGALGTVCEGFLDKLHSISVRMTLPVMQKAVLLGTARILRNFLTKNGQIVNSISNS